jgi:hypothetical protein
MGRPKPKNHLNWHEPLAMNRRNFWTWFKKNFRITKLVVVCLIIMVGAWLLQWDMAGRRIPLADALGLILQMAAVITGFPCLVYSSLYLVLPRVVYVQDWGISYSGYGRILYQGIRHAEFAQVDFSGKKFIVLCLDDNGRQLQIGLSSKVSPDELRKCLGERGIAVAGNV